MLEVLHSDADLAQAFFGRVQILSWRNVNGPQLRQLHDRAMQAHRRNWWEFQMEGRQAEFDASSSLRR